MNQHSMKDRIEFLDIAKAICIVLVVLGHLNPVPEPQAWAAFVKVIYSFHMPLFLFVCGFLFNGSYRNRNYFSFISRKFKHLMLPYFGASVFIIGVKLLAQMFVSVKNPVSPVDFLASLLVYTAFGIACPLLAKSIAEKTSYFWKLKHSPAERL